MKASYNNLQQQKDEVMADLDATVDSVQDQMAKVDTLTAELEQLQKELTHKQKVCFHV